MYCCAATCWARAWLGLGLGLGLAFGLVPAEGEGASRGVVGFGSWTLAAWHAEGEGGCGLGWGWG